MNLLFEKQNKKNFFSYTLSKVVIIDFLQENELKKILIGQVYNQKNHS